MNFEIGIKEIDEQHSEWLRIYDNLNREIQTPEYPDENEAAALLVVQMYRYARMHLKYEEKLLESIGYPALIEHKKEHHYLDSLISDYFVKTCKGDPIALAELSQQIGKWLNEHILGSDRGFAKYIWDNNIDYEKHLPESVFGPC